MKKALCVGRVLFAVAPFLTVSPAAQAGAVPTWNRVFMSTTGSDSNNCSDPATPCRSFVGAQAQTNVGGEMIAMATGGYGLLNITQSVTINGPAGVVIFSNFPVSVNAPGATVVLRGLTIDGTGQTGNGITVTSVGQLHVESCVITGWATGVGSGGNGIFFNSAGQLSVKDTIVRGNGNAGIFVSPSSGNSFASIDRCRVEQNFYGVLTIGSTTVTVKDSMASGNAQALQAEGGDLNVEGCVVANNGYGLLANPGTIRASNCTITGNSTGLYFLGGSLISRGNNTVQGNTTKGSFSGTYAAE